MRVLHLTAGNLYGGIETLLVTLARLRHLAPEMDPAFGVCFRGRLWDELVATGVPVDDFGPVRLSRPWTVWRARRRLREVLANSRPEAVVVHGCWPHVVFGPTVRRAGVRLVHMVHGEVNGSHWLERWAARTPPDLLLANSRFTANSAARLFSQTPAQVIYPPVPAEDAGDAPAQRQRVRSEFSTADDAVVILMVSRIEPLKGHRVLLDALARLRDVPNWRCWIVGGAQRTTEVTLLAELRQQAEALELTDRVRFVGSRTDVPALMAAADIYCQPNVGPEGFGLTFIEALRARLPVVTSGIGGAGEIVDGTCGVLTKAGDAATVADALGTLSRDVWRRQALGTAGSARAQELCDAPKQLARLATLLPARKGP